MRLVYTLSASTVKHVGVAYHKQKETMYVSFQKLRDWR